MKTLLGPLLATLLIASTIFGMIAWMSEINPREPVFGWTVRIASAIVFPTSLMGLVFLVSRPEAVPDFLCELKLSRMGRGCVVYAFDCVRRDGWCHVDIYYQNRYSNRANIVVSVQPSHNFLLSRNEIEPILVQFPCGPAAFGVVHVPIAIKREYQGSSQSFDVSEQTNYPDGLGRNVRNRVGPEMSKLHVSDVTRSVVEVTKMAVSGGLATVKFQSRVNLTLPKRVADGGTPPLISQEERWTLLDDKRHPST